MINIILINNKNLSFDNIDSMKAILEYLCVNNVIKVYYASIHFNLVVIICNLYNLYLNNVNSFNLFELKWMTATKLTKG